MPDILGADTVEQCVGRQLYEEFSTVVILKDQMRVVDPEWHDMLHRLHYGWVAKEDIEMLQKLIIKPTNASDAELTPIE